MVFVHQTMHKANERIVARGGRTVSITPRSYLDFINHYVSILSSYLCILHTQYTLFIFLYPAHTVYSLHISGSCTHSILSSYFCIQHTQYTLFIFLYPAHTVYSLHISVSCTHSILSSYFCILHTQYTLFILFL